MSKIYETSIGGKNLSVEIGKVAAFLIAHHGKASSLFNSSF